MSRKIVGYYGSWAVYRHGAGKFDITEINPLLCTHLIYSFVGLDGDDIKVLDPWRDLPDNGGKDGFRLFNALKRQNPRLKTLVAIGGWNEGSKKYSDMSSNPNSRARFVKNAVAFVQKYGFDGLDVDWEYPCQRGGASSDAANFVALLRELRSAFDKAGLLLSAAVAAGQESASQSYDIPAISKHLHFINLMAYDFHGSWDNRLGLNAPLYASPSDVGRDAQLTVDYSVKFWLSKGAPGEKLILGTAAYGRSFTLANARETQIGSPANGPGNPGPYCAEAGMLGYNEICEMLGKEQWTVTYDKDRRVPYAYRGNQWVGYDNVQSIKEKAEYIKKMGLVGAMVWSIESDDFKGNSGGKFPLINALKSTLGC